MFKIKDCFETCLHSRKHVIDDASNDSFHFDLSYSGVKKATVTMTITIKNGSPAPNWVMNQLLTHSPGIGFTSQ
jgi:hypothetical protein